MVFILFLGSLESPYTRLPICVNRIFSLDITAETLQANIDWKSAFLKGAGVGQFWPK